MAKIIRKETRKRGFFGWLFLSIFVLFNLIMLAWLGTYWSMLSDGAALSEAEKAGRALGGTMGTGVLLMFWVLGDIILGAFVLFSRGRKIIVEETIEA